MSTFWFSGRKLSKTLVFQVNLQFIIEIIVKIWFFSLLSLKIVKNLVFRSKIVKNFGVSGQFAVYYWNNCQNLVFQSFLSLKIVKNLVFISKIVQIWLFMSTFSFSSLKIVQILNFKWKYCFDFTSKSCICQNVGFQVENCQKFWCFRSICNFLLK